MSSINELEAAMLGASMRVERREFDWVFHHSDEVAISVGCLWRLRGTDRLLITSTDDGHQFGLPAPLDAAAEFNRLAGEATITNVSVDETSGDLKITLADGLVVEILCDSSGYESWQASFGRRDIIGRGDGVIGASVP